MTARVNPTGLSLAVIFSTSTPDLAQICSSNGQLASGDVLKDSSTSVRKGVVPAAISEGVCLKHPPEDSQPPWGSALEVLWTPRQPWGLLATPSVPW